MSVHFNLIEGHDALSSTMAFALFSLDQNFFPTPWHKSSWENLFQGHDRTLLVANSGLETIGFSLFDLSVADSFAHLLKIIVHPELRGQGLGRKLLETHLSALQKEGLKHFFLEVEEENHVAQKLYHACGFKVIHRKKDFYGNNRHALIMTAELS
jgi:ribosomal-protein-alanine N-acetyltransferase